MVERIGGRALEEDSKGQRNVKQAQGGATIEDHARVPQAASSQPYIPAQSTSPFSRP